MQAALAPRLGSATAGSLGRRQPITAAQRPWMAAGSRRLALRAAAEGQPKDRHRFVADTESEDEVDPDSDIPMSQRLTARDTFREMARMPPEYPPEPEAYDPDKHRTVDEMASDADEMLPDNPVDMDEEIITNTKPFIQDLYNETAGVKRKAPPRSAASAASNVDAPGHSHGAVGNRPTEGGMAMSLGDGWPVSNLPRGGATRMSTGEDDREQRKAEAEAEVTDMKHRAGQARSEGAGESSGSGGGAEGERIVPEAGPAAAKGAGCSPVTPGIGDKPQPVSGAVAVRGAAKALRAQREAAAKSLQQGGLSEGGPGMADRVVAEAAAQGMEGREEAGSEKGAAATGGGGTGGSGDASQGHATSRATSAQDVGGASGAAGSIEKEAAAQGKEGGQEEEEEELPGWGGSGTREDRRARRRAMEQMGGGDRPERAGLTLFLDKEQRE